MSELGSVNSSLARRVIMVPLLRFDEESVFKWYQENLQKEDDLIILVNIVQPPDSSRNTVVLASSEKLTDLGETFNSYTKDSLEIGENRLKTSLSIGKKMGINCRGLLKVGTKIGKNIINLAYEYKINILLIPQYSQKSKYHSLNILGYFLGNSDEVTNYLLRCYNGTKVLIPAKYLNQKLSKNIDKEVNKVKEQKSNKLSEIDSYKKVVSEKTSSSIKDSVIGHEKFSSKSIKSSIKNIKKSKDSKNKERSLGQEDEEIVKNEKVAKVYCENEKTLTEINHRHISESSKQNYPKTSSSPIPDESILIKDQEIVKNISDHVSIGLIEEPTKIEKELIEINETKLSKTEKGLPSDLLNSEQTHLIENQELLKKHETNPSIEFTKNSSHDIQSSDEAHIKNEEPITSHDFEIEPPLPLPEELIQETKPSPEQADILSSLPLPEELVQETKLSPKQAGILSSLPLNNQPNLAKNEKVLDQNETGSCHEHVDVMKSLPLTQKSRTTKDEDSEPKFEIESFLSGSSTLNCELKDYSNHQAKIYYSSLNDEVEEATEKGELYDELNKKYESILSDEKETQETNEKVLQEEKKRNIENDERLYEYEMQAVSNELKEEVTKKIVNIGLSGEAREETSQTDEQLENLDCQQ